MTSKNIVRVSSHYSPYGNSAKRNDIWDKIGAVTEAHRGYSVLKMYRQDGKWWAEVEIH